jgi:DNA-binding transcriptional MerR regulator
LVLRSDGKEVGKESLYVFPMGVVERLTGLSRRRIRYYEEAGLVHPDRTSGGHRLYSQENVDTLCRVRALVESGITTMESVRRMMASGLDEPKKDKPWGDTLRSPGRIPGRVFGDAKARMRPVETPYEPVDRVPESDSTSYFRRNAVRGDGEKR